VVCFWDARLSGFHKKNKKNVRTGRTFFSIRYSLEPFNTAANRTGLFDRDIYTGDHFRHGLYQVLTFYRIRF
jgi:hypothetical protein